MIYGSDISFMGIMEDKLYFMNSMDGLCVRDLTEEAEDTSWGGETIYDDEEVIDEIFEMCFDGKTIYYTSLKEDGIKRVSIDGGAPETITDRLASDLVLAGGYLYYNDVYAYQMMAYETETKETAAVVPFIMNYYHIRPDGIYGERYDDGILIKYDPSTGVTYELSDRQVAYVCLVKERIFFWDHFSFYCTDLKGRNMIKL